MKETVKQKFPEAKQLEFSVISLLIQHKDNFDKALILKINVDTFYNENCRNIYLAIENLHKRNAFIDINTVFNELNTMQINIKYVDLVSLISVKVDHSGNLDPYITELKDLEYQRKLLDAGKKIQEISLIEGKNSEEKRSMALDLLSDKETSVKEHIFHAKDDYSSFIDIIKNNIANKGKNNLEYPLPEFNRIMKGIGDGLIVIGGLSGGYKTTFLEQIIDHNANRGKRGYFFTAEMNRDKIYYRKIHRNLGIDSKDQMGGNLDLNQLKEIEDFGSSLNNNIVYCDKSSPEIKELVSLVKLEHKKEKLDFVAIDYMQLITCFGKKDKLAEMSEVSRQLMNLAKDLKIPVIVLSQLNKEMLKNDDKEPTIHNLRDSANIGFDATTVLFLHRESFYDKASMKKDVVKVIIGKDRYAIVPSHEVKINYKTASLREMEPNEIIPVFEEETDKKKIKFK